MQKKEGNVRCGRQKVRSGSCPAPNGSGTTSSTTTAATAATMVARQGRRQGGDRGNCGYWTWKVVKLQIIHGSCHSSCKIWPGIWRAGSLSESASRTRNMKNYATRGTQGRSSDSAALERRRGWGHKSSIDRRRLLHNSSLARAPARTPCQVTSPPPKPYLAPAHFLEPPLGWGTGAAFNLHMWIKVLKLFDKNAHANRKKNAVKNMARLVDML